MTDKGIIKALKCHRKGLKYCNECPLQEPSLNIIHCNVKLLDGVYDLIKRQQQEIERLKSDVFGMEFETAMYKAISEDARAEAIKQFAEKLKDKAYPFPCAIGVEYAVPIRAINEIVGADNG